MHTGTLILGTSDLARRVAKELRARSNGRDQLLGVVSETGGTAPKGFPCPHLGPMAKLPEIITFMAPRRVVVATEEGYQQLPVDRLIDTRVKDRIIVETGIEALERLTGKLAIESFAGRAILLSRDFRPTASALAFGRLTSVVLAFAGLLGTLPLAVLIAVAVRLDSPGPVLFVQERVGLGGRKFRLFKFRSMSSDQAKRSEWAGDNEGTITPVGRILRKFRLDEIPQFINIVLGDMNLVGPRPHPESNRQLFVLVARNAAQCGEQIPYYSLRQTVRPGITGWGQVRYKYANGLDEEIEKLRYDLYYIKHYSPWLDMRILMETFKVVLVGHSESKELPPSRSDTWVQSDVADGKSDGMDTHANAPLREIPAPDELQPIRTGNVSRLSEHEPRRNHFSNR